MSALPTFSKTWDFTGINTRIVYASVLVVLQQLLFGIKNYLVATMGAAVWGSCDGATGDNTDRWASKANCATQAATTGGANSWCVIAWGTGQLCLSFVGASADIARISFSPGSLFVLAGTHTFTPTATDECVIATGITWINSVTSGDRVYHITATSDRSVFRLWIFRANVLQLSFGFEKFTEAPNITTGTMYGWNTNVGTGGGLTVSGTHGGAFANTTAGAAQATVTFIGGQKIAVHGATIVGKADTAMTGVETPATINGGTPVWPLLIMSVLVGASGWIGTRFDAFFAWGNANVAGMTIDDIAAGTRIIHIGSMLQPWSTTAGLITT